MSNQSQDNLSPDKTVDAITEKINEIIDRKMTGSVTLVYNFLNGKLMSVDFSTKEAIKTEIMILNHKNKLSTLQMTEEAS